MNGGGRADDENKRRCDEGDINRTENQTACIFVQDSPSFYGFPDNSVVLTMTAS